MDAKPWESWVPGVLNNDQIKELLENDYILVDGDHDIDYSSIDLTLSDEGYEMKAGSIKPARENDGDYRGKFLGNPALSQKLEADGDGKYILKKGNTYLFCIQEKLNNLRETPIYGQATAKSSIGRLDVLARLIVNGMSYYEQFNPDELSEGKVEMFLEISPITFDIKVQKGVSLSQLRLFLCHPEDSLIRSKEICKYALHREAGNIDDNTLSVDLEETIISGSKTCALRAKNSEAIVIDLTQKKQINPEEYWDRMPIEKTFRLQIQKDLFYILRSKERLRLPSGIAVYCRAIDETIGEMRVHYAGFAHPFFGMDRSDGKKGTPLIFEVREHSFPVSLANDEKLAKLEFYRMSRDCEKVQSDDGEDQNKDYNEQELKLSKHFADWPDTEDTKGGKSPTKTI